MSFADDIDVEDGADDLDAEVPAEEWAALVARCGKRIRVVEAAGRRWVLRAPKRPEWIEAKAAKASPDVTTAVQASPMLARRCLLPYDPAGSVQAEREAFDAMCDEYPAMGDLFGIAVEALAMGPLPVRGVRGQTPLSPRAATPTTPPTP